MLFFKYVLDFVKNNNYLELSTPNNIFYRRHQSLTNNVDLKIIEKTIIHEPL